MKPSIVFTERFLEDGSVDILQPDVFHCDRISEPNRVAAMVETYDVALAPHCPLGPVALAACVQVDLTTPNFTIQETSLGIHYNTEAGEYDISSYVADPQVFGVKDGFVDALTKLGPRLGLTRMQSGAQQRILNLRSLGDFMVLTVAFESGKPSLQSQAGREPREII